MSSHGHKYPFKWVPLSDEERERKARIFKHPLSLEHNMVKSIPGNVYMPAGFTDIAERIYNMELRPDDIWIVTYPKCGTTWTQVRIQSVFSMYCI